MREIDKPEENASSNIPGYGSVTEVSAVTRTIGKVLRLFRRYLSYYEQIVGRLMVKIAISEGSGEDKEHVDGKSNKEFFETGRVAKCLAERHSIVI